MYKFIIKDSSPDLDQIITRSMLALAGIAAMVYRTGAGHYLNGLIAAALFSAAVFIKTLLVKYRINKLLLLSVAAILLFIATKAVSFAFLLLLYGYLIKFLKLKPHIVVAVEGITIKKLFSCPAYQWKEFANIILKDGLLTLDFKNNKLIQVSIDEEEIAVDENAFNSFCKGCL